MADVEPLVSEAAITANELMKYCGPESRGSVRDKLQTLCGRYSTLHVNCNNKEETLKGTAELSKELYMLDKELNDRLSADEEKMKQKQTNGAEEEKVKVLYS